LDRLAVIAQVCNLVLFPNDNISTKNTENIDIVQSLKEMSVPLDETILSCIWRIEQCYGTFTEILTEEG
jgi:hypothetical protein